LFEQDYPKDWEIEDEEPPPSLKKKWEKEEASDASPATCPSCKKQVPAGSLSCLYCGSSLNSGPGIFESFAAWLAGLWRGKRK
jgi:hypothetical protein